MSHEKCGSICFQLILVLPEVSVCFSLWKTEGTQCGFTYANDLYQRFESVTHKWPRGLPSQFILYNLRDGF